MYFVDRNQISESLNHMGNLLELYRNENGWQKDIIHSLALERIANVLIESIIDVGIR